MASSKQFPMLKRRGKWWSYRKRVPNHLRPPYQGRGEIVVSLKTQDEGEARIRVLSIAHETGKAIQRARERHRALVVDPRADVLREDHDRLRSCQEGLDIHHGSRGVPSCPIGSPRPASGFPLARARSAVAKYP